MNLPLIAYQQTASPLYSVRDACGVRIASDLSEEDAAAIVTGCNTHDQLVAALVAMVNHHSGVAVAADQRILDAADAALTAAGAL